MPSITAFPVSFPLAEYTKESIDALSSTIKQHMQAHHKTVIDAFIAQVIRQLPELHSLGLTTAKLISFTEIPRPQTLLNEWLKLNRALQRFGFPPKEANDMLNKEGCDFTNVKLLVERFNDFKFFGFTQRQLYSMFMKKPERLPMMAANYFSLMHALNDTITPTLIYTTLMRAIENEHDFIDIDDRILDCKFLLNSPMQRNIAFTIEQVAKLKGNLLHLYLICRLVMPESLPEMTTISMCILLNLKCLYTGNGTEPLLSRYRADQDLFQVFNFSLFKRPTPETLVLQQDSKRLKL